MPGRLSDVKMVEMAEVGAPISLDGVAVHPDCWCICLCYLHFPPENPEDGEMYLLVPAHPGSPGQSPESCKMVVCVCYYLVTYALSRPTNTSSVRRGFVKRSNYDEKTIALQVKCHTRV